ncbi:MAG: gamma-glutamyltransferase [Pseudomonadales bacterium]|nr:gamma-glutamyltransferase [Pseudomonadales bacterium]
MLSHLHFSGRILATWILLSALALLSGCDSPNEPAASDTDTPPKHSLIRSKNAVASAHPLATEAGMEILANGGNAFDAAIAVAAVLGVVEPYSAGIGGGGFWLIHRASDGKQVMIDAREKAPLAASREMYLNTQGDVDRDRATHTPLAAAIPGQAAAFVHLAEHYGALPLNKSLSAAIGYAKQGFTADPVYVARAEGKLEVFQRYPESLNILMNGGSLKTGDRIQQKDLGDTLSLLAKQGFDGFYKGERAQLMVASVRAAGGIWSLEDLAGYQVVEREPIKVAYQNAVIVSAPPPSSGGVAIAQMFNMLSHLNLSHRDEIQRTHLMVEVMRRAYRDRAEYLGDPDFHPVPLDKLLDARYNESLIDNLSHNHATLSSDLKPAVSPPSGDNTTHISILDKDGNYVSATLSINTSFGSGFTVPGTGILLNNEMDDFSAKPGSPNAYGLIGNEANAIEPGKRPLSSMSPSFVELSDAQGNRHIAILGTPGGSRIITMVFLGMLEAIAGKPPKDWVARPRFHHQYLPDKLFFEDHAFNEAQQTRLQALGHQLHPIARRYGNMHGILWNQNSGEVLAAADPRNLGKAMVEGEVENGGYK